LDTVATLEFEDCQFAEVVTVCVVPFESCAVAVSWLVCPKAVKDAEPVTVTETAVAPGDNVAVNVPD